MSASHTPRAAVLRFLILGLVALLPACFLWASDDDEDTTMPDTNLAPLYVIIDGPPNRATYPEGDPVTFAGESFDSEDGELTGSALVWTSDLDGALGTGSPLVVGSLRPGVHVITLTATDSGLLQRSASRTIAVFPSSYGGTNEPPRMTMDRPVIYDIFEVGDAIDFLGDGVDPEVGPLADDAMIWEIQTLGTPSPPVSGEAGRGRSMSKADLPAGYYGVSLSATDPYLATGKTALPGALLVYDPSAACAGTSLSLDADPLELLPGGFGTVTLTIDRSGVDMIQTRLEDGSVDAVTDVLASAGFDEVMNGVRVRHLTVQARSDVVVGDRYELEIAAYHYVPIPPFACRRPLTVEIVATGPGNRPPTVSIQEPAGGSSFAEGEAVVFTGAAADPEEGALTGASLSWSSSIDGPIGTGATFSRDDLAAGQHLVTLVATDAGGLVASAGVLFDVIANAPPAVTIASPSDGQVFTAGQDVSFAGQATDPEDGSLTGAALVWSSDRDGALGTGTTLTRNDLSVGAHTITLTGTDSRGASGSATAAITVVAPANGTIEGTVVAGGFGFPGITVSISGASTASTTTLAGGVYSFPDIPPGDYTVTISNIPVYLTFPVTSMNVTLLPAQTLTVDFAGTVSG